MVSEARGHKVVPSIRTINDLFRKSLYGYDITDLAPQLDKLISATDNREHTHFVIKAFFGQCNIKPLQKLARQIYDQFSCPILEIEFSCKSHWQIYNHNAKKGSDSGKSATVAISDVPEKMLKIATKAARLVSSGLYGLDIKQSGDRVILIEINDNPSIDSGVEDTYLGVVLYDDIMREF